MFIQHGPRLMLSELDGLLSKKDAYWNVTE